MIIQRSHYLNKLIDVKGKKYLDTPYKFYFTDIGLRNARLNFRQLKPSHIMENIIYNELRIRGFKVDIGVVPIVKRNAEGKQERVRLEIDFVCNKGSQKYYIPSAYQMLDEQKIKQEELHPFAVTTYSALFQTARRDNHGIFG